MLVCLRSARARTCSHVSSAVWERSREFQSAATHGHTWPFVVVGVRAPHARSQSNFLRIMLGDSPDYILFRSKSAPRHLVNIEQIGGSLVMILNMQIIVCNSYIVIQIRTQLTINNNTRDLLVSKQGNKVKAQCMLEQIRRHQYSYYCIIPSLIILSSLLPSLKICIRLFFFGNNTFAFHFFAHIPSFYSPTFTSRNFTGLTQRLMYGSDCLAVFP